MSAGRTRTSERGAPAAVCGRLPRTVGRAATVNPLLVGYHLQVSIDAAVTDLGLQGTELFHDRVR
jgi:hypothetical protein